MPAVTRARVFQSGNSQTVRLPKEFRFRSPSVEIFRRGAEVVLRESAATLEEAFDLLAGLSRDFFAGGRKTDLPLEKRAAGLVLVSNNEREFKRVAGLKVENWARD